MNICISDDVRFIIDTLERNGFEAYAVGGCVRDAVLGKVPDDWDICTSALPEQTAKCFDGFGIIETGLQHGTITLRVNHKSYEVTTYRIDGVYTDNRRPDNVEFTSDLKHDLSRRDFTINAMAYNPRDGVIDYFGGISDIENRIIRCVGDADKRFQEDALRIMRALRFASVLGFEIERETSDALFRNKELLRNIAVERIAVELNKLIVGDGARNILLSYTPIFEVFIPEINGMVGFIQNSNYHYLDVWGHTVECIVNSPPDATLRLAMLLHDVAKPECYTEDADGIGHFYGHPQVSADMARVILNRLKYDNSTLKTVTTLILYHNIDVIPKEKYIRRLLNKIGEDMLRKLIVIIRADSLGKSDFRRSDQLKQLDEFTKVLDDVIEKQQCFSLKDLAVDGRDLIAVGITDGTEIGATLSRLLDMVIDGAIDNEKDVLLKFAVKK